MSLYIGGGFALLICIIAYISYRWGKSAADQKLKQRLAESIQENVRIKKHIEYTVYSGDLRELAKLRERWTK